MRLLPWAIMLVVAASYPIGVLAGGLPRFPSRSECIHPARADGKLEAVFGRFSRETDASAMLQRALNAGFTLSKLDGDGCGLLKVFVPGIPTLAVGHDLIAEAQTVGLRVTLEQAGP